MKPQINNIPWENLTHAYGSAEDVSKILDVLYEETDPALLKEAIYELGSNIYHQGTIYDATAYAIPFLIDLLQKEDCKEKNNIFYLLLVIYDGDYSTPVTKDAKIEILQRKDILQNYIHLLDEEDLLLFQDMRKEYSLLVELFGEE